MSVDVGYAVGGMVGPNFGGFDVIESRHCPQDKILVLPDRRVLVRSYWQLVWALLLADCRKAMRADLAALVAAAERRLFGSGGGSS